MMVVIGIIAILGAVVVPGFKKIYSDFKINETYALLDSLFSSELSYYLIYNERNGDRTLNWTCIDERLVLLLSPQLRKFAGQTVYDWHYPWTRWFSLYNGLYLFYKAEDKSYIRISCHTGFSIYDLQWDRLYYLNDLLKRYRKKGYVTCTWDNHFEISIPGLSTEKWYR